MIITRTPFRISFFGGGTDYPDWYCNHNGSVIYTAIDKYCYISCRYLPPFFNTHKYRLVYSKIEQTFDIKSIEHPSIKACLEEMNITNGVEIHHDGDIPAKSGTGSSSTFTVGLLKTLYALNGQIISQKKLAKQAIHIERNVLKETVGCQDQIAAAYGGFQKITFLPTNDFILEPITIPQKRIEELQSHLMLFYTGISRFSSDIAKTFAHDLEKHNTSLTTINQMVDQSINILNNDLPINQFGDLLHEYWQLKRNLSESVSTNQIDYIYQKAIKNGVIGGKIMGAGGGGMILLFVEPDKQNQIIELFKNEMIHIPFKFENCGSQIIHYDCD